MTRHPDEPHLWRERSRKLHSDCRIFQVDSVVFEHQPRNQSGEFFVINSRNWVHTVALTPENEIVMVQQFRFGSKCLSWEIPGGLIEHGEDPIAAGTRELREETGFVGSNGKVLATIRPNPAIQSNTCFIVLLRNVTQQVGVDWDESEEIRTCTMPLKQVEEWAFQGKIFHSLTITALFFLNKYL
ncbi:MAG: ADP-ribose pyrophosphatase [Verrucomicrobia bacterium ADurb.Bin474]|nr:MAG: ADP-ribose pyrophosphatase [Verrucomicrobia bacterium ADurb.Bin474]OPZ71860.1 MAG: ADP-ribose pyrophosphatase [Verrucomicrobia bacterium ADurb.Bin474]